MQDDVLPALTPKQRQCLLFVDHYERLHNRTPNRREISTALRLSRTDPAPVLDPLVRKGYVKRGPARTRRNLSITARARAWLLLHPPESREIEALLRPPTPETPQLNLL